MAVVQGIKEKIHLPIYDSLTVEPGKQLRDAESSSTLKFFVNVQRKTKLETNLQSASLLPHYNTFEARAMRVVISDLPPEFPEDVEATVVGTPDDKPLKTDLKRVMELLDEVREDESGEVKVRIDSTGEEVDSGGNLIVITEADLDNAFEDLDKKAPAKEQRLTNGVGALISRLVYNTVTTFFIGEKVMIQMPTWFFPAGAGPYSEAGKLSTHGEPNPTATFRFAEPLHIDKNQNFRVEIETPDAESLKDIHKIYGPLFIWVVLDGYMTRDVQ